MVQHRSKRRCVFILIKRPHVLRQRQADLARLLDERLCCLARRRCGLRLQVGHHRRGHHRAI